jgi:MFS family permease
MLFVEGFLAWVVTSGAAGVGMALLYPSLMTVPGDTCHPSWRATGRDVYRMCRDAGYGVGAIVVGLAMEFASVDAAFALTAVLMVCSGAVVDGWMEETPRSSARTSRRSSTGAGPTSRRSRTDRPVGGQ